METNSHLTDYDLQRLRTVIKSEQKTRVYNERIAYIREMVAQDGLYIDQDRNYVIEELEQYKFELPFSIYGRYPYHNYDMEGDLRPVTGFLKFLEDEFPIFDNECPIKYESDFLNESVDGTQSCILWYKSTLNWNTDKVQIKMGLHIKREQEIIIIKISDQFGYYYRCDPFIQSPVSITLKEGQCEVNTDLDSLPKIINYGDKSFSLEVVSNSCGKYLIEYPIYY